MKFGDLFNQKIQIPGGDLSRQLDFEPGAHELGRFFIARIIYFDEFRNAFDMDKVEAEGSVLGAEFVREVILNWQEDSALLRLSKYSDKGVMSLRNDRVHMSSLAESLSVLHQVYTRRADQAEMGYMPPRIVDMEADRWTKIVSREAKSKARKPVNNGEDDSKQLYKQELAMGTEASDTAVKWSEAYRQAASTIKGIASTLGVTIDYGRY